MKVSSLKLHINTGLTAKRTNADFDLEEAKSYLKNMTVAQQIEALVRAGVYNINDAGAEDQIREDFYVPGSNAVTPERVLEMVRKETNRMKSKTKAKCTLKNALPKSSKKLVEKMKKMKYKKSMYS